jgi:hypothetical protein
MALKSADGSVASVGLGEIGVGVDPSESYYIGETVTWWSIWLKVDAWSEANQPILTRQFPSGSSSPSAGDNEWQLQRVGSTDAIEITDVSGITSYGPMSLSAIGAIAGTGWHQLIVFDYYYAWDGIVYNSGGTFEPQFLEGAYGYGTNPTPPLTLSPGPSLEVANLAIVINKGATGESAYETLATSIYGTAINQFADTFLAPTGYAQGSSTLYFGDGFWATFDSPGWATEHYDYGDGDPTAVSSNCEWVYGPAWNSYRTEIIGESSMVAYFPLDEPPNYYLDEGFPYAFGGSSGPLGPYVVKNLGVSHAGYGGTLPGPGIAANIPGSNFGSGGTTGCLFTSNDSTSIAFTGPFTIEAWVFPYSGRTTIGQIVAKRVMDGESAPYFDYSLSLGTTGLLTFAVCLGSTEQTAITTTPLTDSQWSHVAAVYDGSALTVFINGTANGTPTSASGTVKTSGQTLAVGGVGSEYFDPASFAGGIGAVALYNSALTATNFAAHIAAAGTLGDPGPATNVRVTQFVDEVLYNATSNVRVTQYVDEVLYNATSNARLTQFVDEVLYNATSNARLTQYVVEVLRTADIPGNLYSVAATSALALAVGSSPSDASPIHAVSASTSLQLATTGSEILGPGHLVSAGSSFQFQTRSIPLVGHNYPVAGTSALFFEANARDPDNTNVAVAASTALNLGTIGYHQSDYDVSASTGLNLTSFTFEDTPTAFLVTATETLNLNGNNLKGFTPQPRFVSATESFALSDGNTISNTSKIGVATSSLSFSILTPALGAPANYPVNAVGSFRLSDQTSGTDQRSLVQRVATAFVFAGLASEVADFTRPVSSGFQFATAVGEGRDVYVAATTSLGLAPGQNFNPFWEPAGSTALNLTTQAPTPGLTPLSGLASLALLDVASGVLALPGGGGAPGSPASSPQGLRNLLRAGVSGVFPQSFAETPGGLVLIANGVDPMLRWDAQAGDVDTAGVQCPVGPVQFGGTGVGTIIGERVAYQRFIDQYGNASILSPVSNTVEFGFDGWIDSLTNDSVTGVVTITNASHGLATGDPIVVFGATGIPIINGTWTVSVRDVNTFTLNGIRCNQGTYTGGGAWVYGIKTVVYSSVPVPFETKVVRRQLLRNLAGNGEVFYVDVDTTDLASTTFSSTLNDEALSANEAVPLQFDDDLPQANRYYPPPSSKSVVAQHMGRIFATCDVTVTQGVVKPTFGSTLVQGYGTQFNSTFVGRFLFILGASQGYEIAAVNLATQQLTLLKAYADTASGLCTFAIRAPLGESKFVYYSEPNLPEAWPPWNAIAVPEDGDTITGLLVKDSYLYILEERTIYKYTLQSDPATDGFLFLSTRRGCLNNRCVVQVENNAYLLDDVGIHKFDGGQSVPISIPIQSIFQSGVGLGGVEVNWAADQTLWHAALDPVRESIRWFVAMSGMSVPRHAICYDYRRDRWWIEEYPFPVTSNVVSTIDYRRSLVGSDGGRVLCLSEGTLDSVDSSVGGVGSVSSCGPLTLLDATAPWSVSLAGAPISIVAGKGRCQQRKITANSADTLSLDRPWLVIPDATSTYQIGGVNWYWRSGWFRYSEDEGENPRDVELIFQPTKTPASLDVELYYDHFDRPTQWGYTQSQDGVATQDGSSLITIDLTTRTGYAMQRLAGHRAAYANGDRFVSANLSGVQGPEATRVYQLTINGAQ